MMGALMVFGLASIAAIFFLLLEILCNFVLPTLRASIQ